MSSDPTVETVTCPSCNETVTIYYEDRECSECGANVSELQKEINHQVRSVKQEVQTIVENSAFELRGTSVQGEVIRVDMRATGPLLIDSVGVDSENMEEVMDRQEDLSKLRQSIEGIGAVTDTEAWYGEEDSNRGSKYGINVDSTIRQEGDVTILTGTNVQL